MGAEDQATGAGVSDDFRDDIGNKSMAHGGNAVDPLGADVAGDAVEHQPRVAVHAEGIVIGNGAGFDRHRLVRQHRVNEDERGAAGFGLSNGVGQEVFGIREIGGDNDLAGGGEAGFDVVLREGHDFTLRQRCERSPAPSFEGVGRGGCVPAHMPV